MTNHELWVHQDYQITNILGGSFSQKTYDCSILDDIVGSGTNKNHSWTDQIASWGIEDPSSWGKIQGVMASTISEAVESHLLCMTKTWYKQMRTLNSKPYWKYQITLKVKKYTYIQDTIQERTRNSTSSGTTHCKVSLNGFHRSQWACRPLSLKL